MRSSGVLMHISSLPSPYGIGTFGAEAYRFVDFLSQAGQKFWQVLPLSPTSYGDSPYQSFSSGAGNPYFIDLELLCAEDLLDRTQVEAFFWGNSDEVCDYGILFENRISLLRDACEPAAAKYSSELEVFCERSSGWLEDYALFMALKYKFGQKPWYEWPDSIKKREPEALSSVSEELSEDICFFKTLQFLFDRQWRALKSYANDLGIGIIGDIPIYVPYDSADVWANGEYFRLNDELIPISVSGCPPDGFTADGQLWGTPVYDWATLRAEGYEWWIKRVKRQLELYDVLRIDHFRGFDAYYSIPYGAKNGRNGVWEKGPGMELFDALKAALGRLPIIAEDLGFLTPSVRQLLSDSGYPGMRVMQFAFDGSGNNDYLPHNFVRNCVAYLDTHDNDTAEGWFRTAPPAEIARAGEYLRIHDGESRVRAMICSLLGSVAELSIISMQDLLELGSEARMNVPGTVGGNWLWRLRGDEDYGKLSLWLREKTILYGRL